MNQAQHDWIERCVALNGRFFRVDHYEKPNALIVDIRERLDMRSRTVAVLTLDDTGNPTYDVEITRG